MATAALPQIETKFSFKGLQEAGKQLSQLRERAAAQFKAIGDSFERRTKPLRNDWARIGKAAQTSFKTIQSGSRGAIKSVQALQKASQAAGKAAASIGRVGARGGAAVAGVVGISAGLAGSTGAYIQQSQKFAKSAGTSVENFQRLSYAARQFGAETDDLQGGLNNLTDKIAEAARGEGAGAEWFATLGISATDANGRLRDTSGVLLDLIDKTKGLNSVARANAFNELLGGDSEKLANLLNANTAQIAALGREAGRLGIVSSPAQIRMAERYNRSWVRLKEAVRGVSIEVGTRLFPTFTRLFNDLARWLTKNRIQIGDWASKIGNSVISVINDVFRMFTGQDRYIQNRWLLGARDRIREFIGWTKTAWRFAKELFYTITGQDERVQEFPWLISLRDQVIATFNDIIARVQAVYQQVIALAGPVVASLVSTFNSISTAVAEPLAHLSAAITAFYELLSGQLISNPDFAYLEGWRDVVLHVADAAKQAFGIWIDAINALVDSLQGLFQWLDIDPLVVGMLFGIARLSGAFTALGLAISSVKGIWGAGKWLLAAMGLINGGGAAASAAGAAASAGGAIGVFNGLGASISKLATGFGVLAARLSVLATVAYGAWEAGKALGKLAYDVFQADDDQAAFDSQISMIRAQGDASLAARQARFPGLVAGSQVINTAAISDALSRNRVLSAAELAGSGDIIRTAPVAAPKTPVNLYLPGGESVGLEGSDASVKKLMAELQKLQRRSVR